MKKEMNNSSESLVPMEDMITVPAAYIEELREILKRLKGAEDNCVALFDGVYILVQEAGELSLNIMIAHNKVEKMLKEYDDHIEDMIDNYIDNEF